MKQYIYLTFILITISISGLFGQDLPSLGIGTGYQMPLQKGSLSSAWTTQLEFYQPLFQRGNFSFGSVVGGDYAFSTDRASISRSGFVVHEDFTSTLLETHTSSAGQHNLGWRIGPQFNVKAGELSVSAIVQTGQSFWSQGGYQLEQEISLGAGEPFQKEIYAREEVKSSTWLVSPRVRVAYPLSNKLRLWTEASLTTSRIAVQERRIDLPAGLIISKETYGNFVEAGSTRQESKENWGNSAVQLGLSLQLGKVKNPPYPKDNNTVFQYANNSVNPLMGAKRVPQNQNPTERSIITPIYPENNARFTEDKPVKELRWRIVGAQVAAPTYVVELQRVDGQGRSQQSYHSTTGNLSVAIEQLAKVGLPEGMYRWQVSEVGTGLQSTAQFFSVGSCQIEFHIQNDTITCLGYEGENRKYRICFESTYQSLSGDLTYTQPGSGLSLFDQNYNALSYTLVAPNTTLQTQAGGSTSSTVHYCVEVVVPPSVTGIGIGLQGDDLDPSPVLCQPGVALSLDELPECICEECDDLLVEIQDMQITSYNEQANQFEFAGNLVANQQLYAIEVQVLSFAYSAQPTPCSSGISVLEESGMILRAGTTINASSDVQFMNSTANPNANGNASKIIRYQDSGAMTGNIPMHIVVGLPGPIAGFDPSCCRLDYEVCFRILVYYDENTCKSCEFIQCFQFDNQ